MGAWSYINSLIEDVMIKVGSKQNRLSYAGREGHASTATGLFSRHTQEQKELIDKALLGCNDNINHHKATKGKKKKVLN